MSRKIRTLIVDDSALVRKAVSDILSQDPDIEVVGTAVDPYVARDKILALSPDVITLDIEMPRMDGITFLKRLMQHRPMPVIIMSSITQDGSTKALEALQAGAVDVVAKPSGSLSVLQEGNILAEKVKAAAQAHLRAPTAQPSARPSIPGPGTLSGQVRRYAARRVILMGASTGGTEALKHVLTALRSDLPGICIVQHIPAQFSLAFANRLNEICQLKVREARHGEKLEPGTVLIAPGGHHLTLKWTGNGYAAEINDGPLVHYQRPAVDVLFRSAVQAGAGPHSLALLLTGMGADGAAGLLQLREQGAETIAQDEQSCVVFGMPREAIRRGAASRVISLSEMSVQIERWANGVALTAAPTLQSSP